MTLRDIALAAAFVLVGAGDWGLEMPSGEVVCVKEPPDRTGLTAEDLCQLERNAIAGGVIYPHIPKETVTHCAPHPECFDDRSNCIPGYHGPRPEGYCR